MTDAHPASLVLDLCFQFHFEVPSPEIQLQDLKYLSVKSSDEVGRHLIEDVGHMSRLQTLIYEGIPPACMPKALPHSLQWIDLRLYDRFRDHPEGKWKSSVLGFRCFDSPARGSTWDSDDTGPVAELLPMDVLNPIQLDVIEQSLRCMTARGLQTRGVL